MSPSSYSRTKTSTTARDIFASIVKYPARWPSVSAYSQLAEAPRRRIWRVMVEPDCCFHCQTRSTNFSRPRSWRVLVLSPDLGLDRACRPVAPWAEAHLRVAVILRTRVVPLSAFHERF